MKKKLLILALLFVSVFTFFVNNFSSNSEELGVRDVYIEDNKYDLSYFENKYDIYNDDISSFEMNETYDSTNDLISNNSLEDEYKIKYKLNVNKTQKYFTFSYILYVNNKIELTSDVKIDIIVYDNEYYFSSSNGYISPCSELYDINNIEKCDALVYCNFDDISGMNLLNSGIYHGVGGGSSGFNSFSNTAKTFGKFLGGIAIAGIGINATSNIISSNNGSSSSSSTPRIKTIDDVLDGTTLGQEMKNKNFKKEDLMALLALMLGLGETTDLTKFYKSDNKVLCIGRDIEKTHEKYDLEEGYQNYARIHGYWAFFSTDYKTIIKKLIEKGLDGLMDFANVVLVKYCCLANWDFILVTNPYYYIEGRYTGQYGGGAYKIELETLRSHNYNQFENKLTWQTIKPVSLDIKTAHFEYAGYRVKKGAKI